MEIFNFGENLRRIRVRNGISQEAMALKMDITQTKYSRIERGKHLPDKDFIEQAAAFLSISPKDLMPSGWDQVKKVKLACSLTPAGRIAYRLLLGLAAYDFARGFCTGAGIESSGALIAIGAVCAMGGFVFWYYTEMGVETESCS